MAEENTADQEKAPAAKAGTAEKAPAKKKEKPPAPEDKPFPAFIAEEFVPSLETALKDSGLADVALSFEKMPLQVVGLDQGDSYWQVQGNWQGGKRRFNIAFTDEDIKSQKLFYYADDGSQPSTIEQFMGDERKITRDLMVLYTLQRLNGQKWLTRN